MKKYVLLMLVILLFIVVSITGGCKAKNTEQTAPQQEENETTQEEIQNPSEEDEAVEPSEEDETADKEEKTDEQPEDESDDSQKASEKQDSNEASSLMPARKDYKWTYSGFAEYGHEMVLESIEKKGNETIYTVKGSVFDLSDGEANRDFSFTITYTAKPGVLVQNVTAGDALMDTRFKDLELIRAPFEKGNTWTQKTKDENGRNITLRSTITDVREENGQKIYTVEYKDTASNYYEKREIKEHVGVLSYEKLYIDKEDSFPIGYYIHYPGTGYKNNLEINAYLPKTGTQLIYFGYAEYGHRGVLKRISQTSDDAIYEFNGVYQDGSGIEDKFTVRYYMNYLKGTVTEKVVSSTRFNTPEVNSKLHNLVILKTPFKQGATWSHNTKIDGKEYKVTAKIKELDPSTGKIKVTYTVQGVPGYFQNTYIEERTFEPGRGMTGFAQLMPGDIPISEADAKNSAKLEEALANHMFGYSIYPDS